MGRRIFNIINIQVLSYNLTEFLKDEFTDLSLVLVNFMTEIIAN